MEELGDGATGECDLFSGEEATWKKIQVGKKHFGRSHVCLKEDRESYSFKDGQKLTMLGLEFKA